MSGNPEEIGEAVPGHIRYWEDLRLEGYRGGPFADRSGGMIVFTAVDEDQAKRIVAGDPFVERGVVGESWLKAWRAE
ncbi:hypothetical protein DWB63_01140 [Pseudodesulfovibrio sp. S3]|nr:hypothetical protein DWB63_01140 [Pseudodesulfovibrio sp. S3]